MNHILFRRLSLVFAASSAGVLMIVLLIFNIAFQTLAVNISLGETNTQMSFTATNDSDFPMTIQGTPLSIELLVSYDGIFVENHNQEQVFNVTAALLRNTADCMIKNACIVLYTKEDCLVFVADRIPAGEAVLVIECRKKTYMEYEITDAIGHAITICEIDNQIVVTETGKSEFSVSNRSVNVVKNVVIYHKSYLPYDDIYIGGLSYRTYIECIHPGESIIIKPEYYAAGYSRIVFIESAT